MTSTAALLEKSERADTWEHIDLISRMLAKAQIELMTRGFAHDRSKLRSPESNIFAASKIRLSETPYGGDEYNQNLCQIKPALDHHYQNNSHHPEHFQNGVAGMNLFDLLEMLIDWQCSAARNKDGDIERSIEICCNRFNISPEVEQILRNTLPWVQSEFSKVTIERGAGA